MSEVVLIMGCPAAGKGTTSDEYIAKGYIHLNRDKQGGKVVSLVPIMEQHLKDNKNVILDNLYATVESRLPFIQACKKLNVPIKCLHISTSIEDGQINALRRMYKKYNRFFMNADELKGVKDDNMFPPLVLFKYRKDFEPPSLKEGFDSIDVIKFKRTWEPEYKNKALILDYDQNIRETTSHHGYPTKPDEVYILPRRKEKIQEYVDQGYILCGISNQSGVHKGNLTYEDAVACFDRTNELLGHDIDYTFCPHQSSPPTCFCRKPQTGNLIRLVEKYKLSVQDSVLVGDQQTDKSCADRVGMPFIHTFDFFGKD